MPFSLVAHFSEYKEQARNIKGHPLSFEVEIFWIAWLQTKTVT